jgi:hypothetical protein
MEVELGPVAVVHPAVMTAKMPVKNKDGRTHLISSEQAGDASENLSYRGASQGCFSESPSGTVLMPWNKT